MPGLARKLCVLSAIVAPRRIVVANLYLSATRECGKTLALKPITNRLAQYMDPPPTDLSGYFLIEDDGHSPAVLARVETEDAALRLGRLLGLA